MGGWSGGCSEGVRAVVGQQCGGCIVEDLGWE